MTLVAEVEVNRRTGGIVQPIRCINWLRCRFWA